MLFGLDLLGFVLFEPDISSNTGPYGGVSPIALGWLITWGSVWVLVTGSLHGPFYTTAANVVMLLAYIVLGMVLTVTALGVLRSIAADIVPQESPPAELTPAVQLTLPESGYCIAPDDEARPK